MLQMLELQLLITYTLHVQLKTIDISLESKLWVRALVPVCGAAWSNKTGFGGSGKTACSEPKH